MGVAPASYVEDGGYALFLETPKTGDPYPHSVDNDVPAENLPLNAKLLTGWATSSGWSPKSFVVTEHPVFDGLPQGMIMHGVYENVQPQTAMLRQEGKYISGLIAYEQYHDHDKMLRHYNGPGDVYWAGGIVETEIEEGSLMMNTWRILENVGQDPVAEILIFNLIEYAASQAGQDS